MCVCVCVCLLCFGFVFRFVSQLPDSNEVGHGSDIRRRRWPHALSASATYAKRPAEHLNNKRCKNITNLVQFNERITISFAPLYIYIYIYIYRPYNME